MEFNDPCGTLQQLIGAGLNKERNIISIDMNQLIATFTLYSLLPECVHPETRKI